MNDNNQQKNNRNKKKFIKNRKPNSYNKSRNRRPKSLSPGRLLQKYENLLDQAIVARKKYFSVHGRNNNKLLNKASSNYDKCLNAIVTFKKSLKDWQLETLNKKLDFFPEDNQYSKDHQDEKAIEVNTEGDFEDPHFLEIQKEAKISYANDTEESTGTIDDYNLYKGI